MMSELNLTLAAARALHLAAQGMLQPRRRKAAKADVLEAIRQMGMLQIDTISVVARSPYLVLWSRLGDYDPAWLEQHLAEGRLFEYWAHEACFVPIEDYGLYRHRMIDPSAMGWKYSETWMRERAGEVEQVLSHIRAQRAGPLVRLRAHRRQGRRLVGVEAREALAGSAVHVRRADDRAAPQLPARVRPGRTRASGLGRQPDAADGRDPAPLRAAMR